MSKQSNNGNSAKNRPAGASDDLNIPTLGQSAPASILQEGESPAALAGSATGDYHGQANERLAMSLADIQREADAARSTPAQHRPAILSQEREQFSEVPPISLEMPLSGSLDAMRRHDQTIEPVTDMGGFKDKAEALAFLEEMMIIRIHETGNPNDEPLVPLSVNGRGVFIRRGEDAIVRRKYVEQLLRAKPEHVSANADERDRNGNPINRITKSRSLKYPFSIIRDDNPRGRAWERKIRAEA